MVKIPDEANKPSGTNVNGATTVIHVSQIFPSVLTSELTISVDVSMQQL